MAQELSRRALIAAALAGAGCSVKRPLAPAPAAAPLRFAPVRVSEDRVIRTVVGLRPYRPSGFVVRRETLGGKTLVHNYGHGGGGITLSWGTSHLAVEAAGPLPSAQTAVLGCGAVGLATARLLQLKGARVTIYARELPPETTSNIAGGQWWPTSVFDPTAAAPAFLDQFVRAARLSHRWFQTLPGARYGIRWIRNYQVSNQPLRDSFILGPSCPFQELYPEYADLPPNATPFAPYARRFTTMLVEPHIYLPAMLQDFHIAGGRIVVRGFDRIEEVAALPEPAVFNCTGLGSGELFGDTEILPVRGQLTFLLPQPEIDYILLAGRYMFPRSDGILLGGTFEHGNRDLTPNLDTQRRMLEDHRRLFAKIA